MTKSFDCVKMKWDIQRRIMEEFAEVPAEEARRIQRQQIEADPILGPFLRKVTTRKTPTSMDQD